MTTGADRGSVTVNFSPSKQMYSFGKANRFGYKKSPYDCFYYNLPNLQDKRATSIGYGQKSDFSKPVPGRSTAIYNIPREFDLNRKNSPQYSFGLGREQCVRPGDKVKNASNPGPGNYDTIPKFGSEALKFSLHGRHVILKDNKETPGPGSYGYMSINTKGRYPNSSFENSPQCSFGSNKGKRFNYSYNSYPGPGQYNNKAEINGTGVIYSSRYESNLGKSLGIKHKDMSELMNGPGPGAYNVFSEFEGFDKPGQKN